MLKLLRYVNEDHPALGTKKERRLRDSGLVWLGEGSEGSLKYDKKHEFYEFYVIKIMKVLFKVTDASRFLP